MVVICYLKTKLQPTSFYRHTERLKPMSRPLLFQSKLLCFSLLYLFTCLFFVLYASLSRTRCLFAFTPSDQIRHTLFSYPTTYGERKYSVPTTHSSCSSPIYFSGYMQFRSLTHSRKKIQSFPMYRSKSVF